MCFPGKLLFSANSLFDGWRGGAGRGCAVRLPGTSPPSLMGFSVFIAHVYKDPSSCDSSRHTMLLRLNSSAYWLRLSWVLYDTNCFIPVSQGRILRHTLDIYFERLLSAQVWDKKKEVSTDKSKENGNIRC